MLTNEPRHRHPWLGTGLPSRVRGLQRWVAAGRSIARHNRRLSPSAPTLHFFPMQPDPMARITRIVERLGLRIGTDVSATEPTIAWDTGTWFAERARRRLPAAAINGRCLDISKSRVDREWAAAAGYSITVDPLAFDGALVVKSELNGRHDGRIVRGPLPSRRDDRVYQRFVDSVEGDLLIELRTTVIGSEIPIVLRRGRPVTRWFEDTTVSVPMTPSDVFSAAELAHLRLFSTNIGMDYGELDVLRDKNSGRIYVVDANRTPYGPVPHAGSPHIEQVTTVMTDAFERLMAERWP
jgi:hypothetical protein